MEYLILFVNDFIGVLECIKLELYRRVATPYEDKKKEAKWRCFLLPSEKKVASELEKKLSKDKVPICMTFPHKNYLTD